MTFTDFASVVGFVLGSVTLVWNIRIFLRERNR